MPVMSRAEKASYDDAVAELPNKLGKDGTDAMEGDLVMADHKVTKVGAGTVDSDATNLGQVEDKFALGHVKARRNKLKGL